MLENNKEVNEQLERMDGDRILTLLSHTQLGKLVENRKGLREWRENQPFRRVEETCVLLRSFLTVRLLALLNF